MKNNDRVVAKKKIGNGKEIDNATILSTRSIPQLLRASDGNLVAGFYIEQVEQHHSSMRIQGWAIGSSTFKLYCGTKSVAFEISRMQREDVARAHCPEKIKDGIGFDITASSRIRDSESYFLVWTCENENNTTEEFKFLIEVEAKKKVELSISSLDAFKCAAFVDNLLGAGLEITHSF